LNEYALSLTSMLLVILHPGQVLLSRISFSFHFHVTIQVTCKDTDNEI
jgi:hypothetical protein